MPGSAVSPHRGLGRALLLGRHRPGTPGGGRCRGRAADQVRRQRLDEPDAPEPGGVCDRRRPRRPGARPGRPGRGRRRHRGRGRPRGGQRRPAGRLGAAGDRGLLAAVPARLSAGAGPAAHWRSVAAGGGQRAATDHAAQRVRARRVRERRLLRARGSPRADHHHPGDPLDPGGVRVPGAGRRAGSCPRPRRSRGGRVPVRRRRPGPDRAGGRSAPGAGVLVAGHRHRIGERGLPTRLHPRSRRSAPSSAGRRRPRAAHAGAGRRGGLRGAGRHRSRPGAARPWVHAVRGDLHGHPGRVAAGVRARGVGDGGAAGAAR